MAQASAGMAANPSTSGAQEWGGPAESAEQQQQQATMVFPRMQPGLLTAADGTTPLMIPIMMQQPGASAGSNPAMQLPPGSTATAVPALAAFAAAAASSQQQAASAAVPRHATPVAALLGPAAAGAAVGGDTGPLLADSFSFRPASADGGSSIGHSTPRAASAAPAAATAAADFAFALYTPAGATASAPAITLLERLLPAADAGAAAVAAVAATGRTSARATPTKRKPARTMTAALM